MASSLSSPQSASAMRCPDCSMTFRDAKLLHKHRQRFCPGITETPPQPQPRNRYSADNSLREDILRLEARVAEALSQNKQSLDEDGFWKLRQKQAEELDQVHQIRLVELRERDRRLADERHRIQGQTGSLGMLAMIQAMKPRTPPPPPPPMPPPTIIPPSQPFIVPPNPPPPPQVPLIIEPPPAQPPQIITIGGGGSGPTYPPLPPPPPIIQPPSAVSGGSSFDPSHLMLLQQIRDTDAAHQSGMRELQAMLKEIEQEARKKTPPPIHIPSPQPPIILPRPEPPIIINPPAQKAPPTVITMAPPPPPSRPFMYIGGAGSIIGEVQTLRHAYTQNGGADADMIFALAQLEREARDVGDSKVTTKKHKCSHKRRSGKPQSANVRLETTLQSIEVENDRLSREINLLQQQSVSANMNSRATEALERRHMEYVRKISQLERDTNNRRLEVNHADDKHRQATLTMTDDGRRERLSVGPPQQLSARSACPHGAECVHCGGGDNVMYSDQKIVPAPSFRPVVGPTIDFPPLYPDQTETSTAGMYIFWDFVIGLPPETTAVRLHSALYNDTYALGRPTSLPVFYTQQLPESSFFPYNMRIAMMSMMQQIPGCEPSADLSIIVETHLSIASGPLSSKAWVKLDIFDEKLRVKSGRWRVALRCVPVETSISTSEVHTLNQYHRAELFFRLATHAQAQIEGKQKMNPNYANYYNYLKPTVKMSSSPRPH